MKKILMLIVVAVGISLPSQAQVKFGLKGGLNLTSMSFNENAVDNALKNKAGFFVGPTVKIGLPVTGLSVDASALYDQRESKIESNGQEATLKSQSLQVPINIRYGVGLGSVANLFAFAGPQFGFNLGDKTKEIYKNAMDWTLRSSNISANVTAGEAGGFEYYITPKNGDQTVWEGAPGASYSNSNGVTWNLSEAGKLKDGWIYTLKFTVWPSQEAYDLIADLNNGKKTMTEDQLEAAGIANNGGVYTLKTNTHLYTTFKDLEGNEYRKVNDYREEAMNLPTKTISIKKEWPENFLDQYGVATYRDEDGNEKTATEITLTLERDSEDYLDVTVNSEDGWQKDDVYISCGQIVVKDGNADIKEVGHDFTRQSPRNSY